MEDVLRRNELGAVPSEVFLRIHNNNNSNICFSILSTKILPKKFVNLFFIFNLSRTNLSKTCKFSFSALLYFGTVVVPLVMITEFGSVIFSASLICH